MIVRGHDVLQGECVEHKRNRRLTVRTVRLTDAVTPRPSAGKKSHRRWARVWEVGRP